MSPQSHVLGGIVRCWIIRWNQRMHSTSDCSLTVCWLKLMRVQTKYRELESPSDKTCFGKNTSLTLNYISVLFRPLTLKAEIIVYKTQRQCWVGGSRHQLLASHGSVSLNRRISLIYEQEHWMNLCSYVKCNIDRIHVKHLMIVENPERS